MSANLAVGAKTEITAGCFTGLSVHFVYRQQ